MVVTRVSKTRNRKRAQISEAIDNSVAPIPDSNNNNDDEQEAHLRAQDQQQQQQQQHDDQEKQMMTTTTATTKHKMPDEADENEEVQVNGNSNHNHNNSSSSDSSESGEAPLSHVKDETQLIAGLVPDSHDSQVKQADDSHEVLHELEETAAKSSLKRKHEDEMDEIEEEGGDEDPESEATDIESADCDEVDDDAFDDSQNSVKNNISQSPAVTAASAAAKITTTPVSIKSRRPSRSCKPNSLIFNSDTTTLSPKRRRKVVRTSTPAAAATATSSSSYKSSVSQRQSLSSSVSSPAADLTHSLKSGSKRTSTRSGQNKSHQQPQQQLQQSPALISSRSFARESVRKAVSALTGLNRPVKKLGRPRKYPLPEDSPESVSPVKTNGRLVSVKRGAKGRKVVRAKRLTVRKGSSPNGNKCTPILTAILSGQSLAETKTGRPKGRPRVLPSLDEVILNGAKSSSSSNTSATRSSPRRCDCEAKYKKILGNLEQSLEVKFAESTHKLRKDMEQSEAENTRLQNRISSLQRELEYLKNRLDHAKDTTASRQEIDDLKLKHQIELSLAKRTQWCANCERESLYFCCWNSSYCSLECQQQHWHAVHKKVCRNKDVKR